MSKIVYILIILIILSLAINIFQFKKYKADLQLSTNICNVKASSLLFGIESNRIKAVKDILQSDLVQLIHDYDSITFKRSKVLSGICNDWEKVIKRPIENYLNRNKNKQSKYLLKVKKNYKNINRKCR